MLENLEQSPEIGTEKLLEIVRGLFGDKETIGFQALPVRNRSAQAALHG
jgi:hypothetical protein